MSKYLRITIVLTVFFLALLLLLAIVLSLNRIAQGAELSLGLNYLSGQHDAHSLNLGLNLPFLNETAVLSSKLRYGSHDSEIVQNQGHLRLGYDPVLTEKWSLWFYEQVGYDKPKEIDFESFTGGGPKYTFYWTDTSKASASVGYLYHYQEARSASRLSVRLKGRSTLGLVDLMATCFYQPNIENFEDYLASAEIGVSMAIAEDLSLKLSVEDHYRSMLKDKNEFLTGLHLVVEF